MSRLYYFASCYTIFDFHHNCLRSRLPYEHYGRYYLFHTFPCIYTDVLPSVYGIREMTDQRSPKPSFNPPAHHPPSLLSQFTPRALSTAVFVMGPGPLNVFALPSPKKPPKASGPSVNDTTKQLTAVKDPAPEPPHRTISRIRTGCPFSYVSLTRTGLNALVEPWMSMSWTFPGGGFRNRSRRYLNGSKPNSTMYPLRSSSEVRAASPSRSPHTPTDQFLTCTR